MIIQEIDFSLFFGRFEDMDRAKNFSYSGLNALFEYLDELSEEKNPYKLDVVALDSEFSEYKDFEDFKKNSGYTEYERLEDLEEETTVIRFDEGFIVGEF